MPVRLSPRGSRLISYDPDSKEWVAIDGAEFCILPEQVEIEPGTTLADIFRIVENHPDLKGFLTEYCSCDIDALHSRPPVGDDLIEVATNLVEKDDGSPPGHRNANC